MLLTVVAPPVVPGAGAAPVITVPSSIDATGGRDVTQALNTFFAAAPAGATVRFPSGGRFRIVGVLIVSGRRDVTIEGNGSTLVAPTDGSETRPQSRNVGGHWPRRRSHVDILDSAGITVRDLTVQGPNPGGRYVPN